MRTLSVLSRKGGTGKTTVSLHMAVAAQMAGHRTLVADLDPQRSTLEWARERKSFSSVPTITEAKVGSLFNHRLNSAREGYDLMVIDTRPSTDLECAEAVRWADVCLIVVRPCYFDLKAIGRTVEMVNNMNKKGLFLINQAPSRRNGEEPKVILETYEALLEMGLPVAPVGLRYRAAFQNAVREGKVVQEYDPDSLAAAEVNLLWNHVSEVLWPTVNSQSVAEGGDQLALVS
jgi:chromosome partitioning protein